MEFFPQAEEPVQLLRLIPVKKILERWKTNEAGLADIVELHKMGGFFLKETRRRPDGTDVYFCEGPYYGIRFFYEDGDEGADADIVYFGCHGRAADTAFFDLNEVERIEKKCPYLLWPLAAPFQKTHGALFASLGENTVAEEPVATEGKQAVQAACKEMENTMTTIVVFISYAWKDHDRPYIGRLVQWLGEKEGIKVISDHLFPDGTYPEDGWPIWMEKSIKEADIVLCICGENYKKAFEGEGGGKGSRWEGAIITNDLYERFRKNKKYSVILPKVDAHELVPSALKEWNSNILLTDSDLIHRHIKAQYKLQKTGETQVPQNDTPTLEKNTEKKQIMQQQGVSGSQNSSGATQVADGVEAKSVQKNEEQLTQSNKSQLFDKRYSVFKALEEAESFVNRKNVSSLIHCGIQPPGELREQMYVHSENIRKKTILSKTIFDENISFKMMVLSKKFQNILDCFMNIFQSGKRLLDSYDKQSAHLRVSAFWHMWEKLGDNAQLSDVTAIIPDIEPTLLEYCAAVEEFNQELNECGIKSDFKKYWPI